MAANVIELARDQMRTEQSDRQANREPLPQIRGDLRTHGLRRRRRIESPKQIEPIGVLFMQNGKVSSEQRFDGWENPGGRWPGVDAVPIIWAARFPPPSMDAPKRERLPHNPRIAPKNQTARRHSSSRSLEALLTHHLAGLANARQKDSAPEFQNNCRRPTPYVPIRPAGLRVEHSSIHRSTPSRPVRKLRCRCLIVALVKQCVEGLKHQRLVPFLQSFTHNKFPYCFLLLV
jgi:hypothetical protein